MTGTMRLHQVVAIAEGKKSYAKSKLTEAHHKVQKAELLAGISRVYKPKNEDGDQIPSETKNVQFTVGEAVKMAQEALTELFDVVFTQDSGNCIAKANVVVGDTTIATDVPVTTLLFLDKQLTDIKTFVEKLPVLDPGETWHFDSVTDSYRSDETETNRTKKVMRNHVLQEATEKHPAQVQVYTEDEVVGRWKITKFSGAIPESNRRAILDRVRMLQEAVKIAREEANSVEVQGKAIGKQILSYIFGG